jgi:hypothetical protein
MSGTGELFARQRDERKAVIEEAMVWTRPRSHKEEKD